MSWQAWMTCLVILSNIGLLIFTSLGTDLVLMAGLSLLVLTGVLSPAQALAGFANEGMATVGLMFVVVAGLEATGGIVWLSRYLLGQPKTVLGAQLRMMLPVATLSAFMNNTPLVAMMIPAVIDWAKKLKIPPSKLLMPLSHAAVLGGVVTLIGTSTNLVVSGLIRSETDLPPLSLFAQAPVGIPVALIGICYITLMSRWLLPNRQAALNLEANFREYAVEMTVAEKGLLVNKSIEEAGLRRLSNLYLAEILRGDELKIAVSPDTVLKANDQLFFVGAIDSVVELNKMAGLVPATKQLEKLSTPRSKRQLIEAVVSNSCPISGKSIRQGEFRSRYDAVVIAVSRNGSKVQGRIGDIVLHPGDTLLLEAKPSFVSQQRNSQDFYLVSHVENSSPLKHERSLLAFGILFGMILLASFGILPMFQAALLAAGAMILTRCVSSEQIRQSVSYSLLITIAASFGLGKALEQSGAAITLANSLGSLAQGNPWLSLGIVYATTVLITEFITNNGAAVLMFPIALATANHLGVNPMPFAIAIMMAASCAFATPIGYQTNLMVYGPGGYRFTDFTRMGLPLNVICGIVSVTLIPHIWPF
ncbi:MAG: SLC13 family permease [Trueperaceae bacterium]|nr:SLC13 family permease [Trueperaceae bacterium]